ncbi:MAG: hypothetical protein CL808_04340 [Citromicrobium sp.]|nr:hypothetical protein [Citromicrobium sp.]
MRIVPLLLIGATLAACEPLLPSADRDEPEFGDVDAMQASPSGRIIDTAPIAGTDWLLARVGWSDERRGALDSSSGYAGARVANIVILDKETGASVSLLPNERNRVRDHRIIWPVSGPVEGSAPSDDDDGIGPVAPTHFMLDAELREGGPGARRLLIGSFDDFRSSLVARGYVAIHHVEMLDEARLSILLGYPDRDELMVVDLPGSTIERRRWIDPSRVAR